MAQAWQAARAFVRSAWVDPLVDPATWRATLYHLLDGAVAWLGIGFVALGLTASVWLTPFALVGLAVLAVLLHVSRWLGAVERGRARWLLGLEVAEPVRPDRRGLGLVDHVRVTLRDGVAWRAVAYLVVRFPLGVLASVATLTSWYVAVSLVTSPVWGPLIPASAVQYGVGFDSVVDTWWEYTLAFLLGMVALALAPRVVGLLAGSSRWVVRSLLGPGVGARIQQLEGQRSSAVRSADVDRRRIEQDLHDGAQVRLTALAMHLGLAREALAEGADRDRVAELVEEAHVQAKVALREIRDLARGIHPAILTDRGLEAALVSMVGRLPVPVELEVDVATRPSPAVESIAYFVAAEALTNAVRHADSATVGVRVVCERDDVVVEVRDRGRGGADPASGTGLANLRARVEAAGGDLSVQSPVGVGTLVRAVMPCGS